MFKDGKLILLSRAQDLAGRPKAGLQSLVTNIAWFEFNATTFNALKCVQCSSDGRHALLLLANRTLHLLDVQAEGGARLVASTPRFRSPVHSVYLRAGYALTYSQRPGWLHVLDGATLVPLRALSVKDEPRKRLRPLPQRLCFLGAGTVCIPGQLRAYDWRQQFGPVVRLSQPLLVRLHHRLHLPPPPPAHPANSKPALPNDAQPSTSSTQILGLCNLGFKLFLDHLWFLVSNLSN